MKNKIFFKKPEEIEIMKKNGIKLARIKEKLSLEVKEGVSALDIENLATKLISEEGGEPSFKMVPGYKWSTCINLNEGVVHGIPKENMVFRKGDLVSLDIGYYEKGFHTDTSVTLLVEEGTTDRKNFLEVGKKALKQSLKGVTLGNKVRDVSKTIEKVLTEAKLQPIKVLSGHGIGRNLHERPLIPCFVSGVSDEEIIFVEGLVLAIEVIYSLGSPDLVLDNDGWTIRTKDGKISGLFEETVAVTANGPLVLTQ